MDRESLGLERVAAVSSGEGKVGPLLHRLASMVPRDLALQVPSDRL